MAKSLVKVGVEAEKLIPQINANHRECIRSGKEALERAQEAGELLWKLKEQVKHGEFHALIEQRCDFSLTIAKGYMAVSEGLPRLLEILGKDAPPEISIKGAVKLISQHLPKSTKTVARRPKQPKRGSVKPPEPPVDDRTVCPRENGAHRWIDDDERPGEMECGKCGEPRDSLSSPGWGASPARKPLAVAVEAEPVAVKQYHDSFDTATLDKQKSANGKPKEFNDGMVEKLYGQLTRVLDDKTQVSGSGGANGAECRNHLKASYKSFLAWSGRKK